MRQYNLSGNRPRNAKRRNPCRRQRAKPARRAAETESDAAASLGQGPSSLSCGTTPALTGLCSPPLV